MIDVADLERAQEGSAESALAQALRSAAESRASDGPRVDIDPEHVRQGLGKLVLTVVRLLHELMERQAVRRIEAGSLSEEQIEDLGLTLMRQAEEIEVLREHFGLGKDDLNLDLGPLGSLI